MSLITPVLQVLLVIRSLVPPAHLAVLLPNYLNYPYHPYYPLTTFTTFTSPARKIVTNNSYATPRFDNITTKIDTAGKVYQPCFLYYLYYTYCHCYTSTPTIPTIPTTPPTLTTPTKVESEKESQSSNKNPNKKEGRGGQIMTQNEVGIVAAVGY